MVTHDSHIAAFGDKVINLLEGRITDITINSVRSRILKPSWKKLRCKNMRNLGKTKWIVLLVALALALTALPMAAMAAATVEKYDFSGIVEARESEYQQMPIGHVDDGLTVYVPIKNVSGRRADQSVLLGGCFKPI
jgi:hypothetical protein